MILAGGLGTRFSEETALKPKPMIEIGGKPILWHIMNIYAHYGYKEFVVACGYKGDVIKEYFHNFFTHNSDFKVNLKDGSKQILLSKVPDWQISLIDTGLSTMTGGRILRLRPFLEGGRFMVTYGDGVGNVDIPKLVDFHKRHGKYATITAVRPPARFGSLVFDGDRIAEFSEKSQASEGWISGGFFVFEPQVFDYFESDETILERKPLERLAAEGQLMAYKHEEFWHPMDTLRDKQLLDSLWNSGTGPWKVW